MVVLQKRSRLVTFHVSADEYDSLMAACLEAGARSLAAYARRAVLKHAQMSGSHGGTIQGDLNTLGKTLADLDATLDIARKKIRDILGPET